MIRNAPLDFVLMDGGFVRIVRCVESPAGTPIRKALVTLAPDEVQRLIGLYSDGGAYPCPRCGEKVEPQDASAYDECPQGHKVTSADKPF